MKNLGPILIASILFLIPPIALSDVDDQKQIEQLKAELIAMSNEDVSGLSGEDIWNRRNVYLGKLDLLDALRSRHQAVVPVDKPTLQSTLIPQPESVEEVYEYLKTSRTHALYALDHFAENAPSDKLGVLLYPIYDATTGVKLTDALKEGVARGHFSSMESAMALTQFAMDMHDLFVEERGDYVSEYILHSEIDRPISFILQELAGEAIMSWLNTNPAKKLVWEFFTATKQKPIRHPALIRPFSMTYSAEWFFNLLTPTVTRALFDMGLFTDLTSQVEFFKTARPLMGSFIPESVALQLAETAATQEQRSYLVKNSSFKIRVLLIEIFLEKGFFKDAAEINSLLYELSDYMTLKRELKSVKFELGRLEANEGPASSILQYSKERDALTQKIKEQLQQLRWIGYRVYQSFQQLNPSENERRWFKDYVQMVIPNPLRVHFQFLNQRPRSLEMQLETVDSLPISSQRLCQELFVK